MSRRKDFFISMAAAFLLTGGMTSCMEELAEDDHYKAPSWLKGNAYEVLKGEGNHSVFLKGVDLSDYRSIVDGKSIVTVVAPDDDAFMEFLSKKGYSSIEELNERDHDYLNKLIGYHLMYYAFDWSKMVNFRPGNGDAATDAEKEIAAGCYYKHRTHSIDAIKEARVKLTPNASSDTLIKIYHYERYLPVLSNKLFETKGIDPAYNYNYFFPETKWNGRNGAAGGFNVANAYVKDDANVITDNGYLYHVDHVVEPLNTIYDELKSNPDYSQYLALYDKYSEYQLADADTRTSLGYDVYVHSHGALPPIAWEWPTLSWQSFTTSEIHGYNVFAPSNKAINDFFKTYWTKEGGYESLDDLDPLILEYFIKQSFTGSTNERPDDANFIVFPQEVAGGMVVTSYGSPITVNPDEVTYRRLCCNGALYGMDKMDAPAIFSSVVGPAFSDTTYQSYLYALDGSGAMLTLSSKNADFVTLMPSNKQFQNCDPAMRLYTTTNGKELQQYSDDAGDFVAMGSSAKLNIVNMHTAQNISELKKEGTQVVVTNEPYNYWFVYNGQITTNARFNEQLEPSYKGSPFVDFKEIQNNGGAWNNGRSYSYDYTALFEAASGDGLSRRLAVCNDKNYPYYLFAQLLQKAGLASGTSLSETITTADTRFFVFIPTNDAIKENLSKIPGCSKLSVNANGELTGTVTKAELMKYLSQYFVNSMMNSFTAYPYLGSSCNGEFYTGGANKLNVTDNGSNLSVNFVGSDAKANVIADYHCLPFAFADGCFHLIDGILE